MNLYEVLDKIRESTDFTVGGGSASALAGSMAAGLVGMAVRLSIGKDYGLSDGEYEKIAGELDGLSDELGRGAIGDCEAFLGIKRAYALPRETEEDKQLRREAVEKAAVNAAEVPLANGGRALRVAELCEYLKGKFNSAAASDLEIGGMLAADGALGCALNIDANLPLIKTPEERSRLEKASEELKERLKELKKC